MKLYRTRTKDEYDYLMQKLEDEGCEWEDSKDKPTKQKYGDYKEVIYVRGNTLSHSDHYYAITEYDDKPIIEVSTLMTDHLANEVLERNNKPESLEEPLDLIASHKRICEHLNKVYADKNHDYGNSFGETYEKLGAISAVTRISDKTSRLQSLVTKDEQRVDDERLIDTALDLANYAIMFAMELEEEHGS